MIDLFCHLYSGLFLEGTSIRLDMVCSLSPIPILEKAYQIRAFLTKLVHGMVYLFSLMRKTIVKVVISRLFTECFSTMSLQNL